MRSLRIVVPLVMLIPVFSIARGQNVREGTSEERKQADEAKAPTRTYTNADLEIYHTGDRDRRSGELAPARSRPAKNEGITAETELRNQEELGWSRRFLEARTHLQEVQDREKKLKERLFQLSLGCTTDTSYDPYYLFRAREQLDDNEKALLAAQQALDDLREELRKSGMPVSWEYSERAAASPWSETQPEETREKGQKYWQEQLALIDKHYQETLEPLEVELFELVYRRSPRPDEDLTIKGSLGISCIPQFVIDLDTQIKTLKHSGEQEKVALVERAVHEGALPGWFR